MFSFKADTKEALLLKQAVVHENLAENAFQFSFLQLKEKLHEHKVKVKVKSLSCVRLFATPWTIAHQAPPSIGFSRQEYWSGFPFPSPEDLPNPEIELRSPPL